MTPDAKLRMDVYQEGQRAYNKQEECPYNDWRAKTWAKGYAAAQDYYFASLAPQAEAEAETPWTGCGECDVAFPCHNGAARCLRLHEPEKGTVTLPRTQEHETLRQAVRDIVLSAGNNCGDSLANAINAAAIAAALKEKA